MDVLLKKPKDDVKEEMQLELNGGESTNGEQSPPKFAGDASPVMNKKRSRSSSPSPEDATHVKKQNYSAYQNERSLKDSGSTPSPQKDFLTKKKQESDQLESTRIEMGEVRQENERLKMVLAQIMKDYNALQKQFQDVVQQDETNKVATSSETTIPEPLTHSALVVDDDAEAEMVSLSLGRSSSSTAILKKEDHGSSRPASASNSGVGKVEVEKKSLNKDLMLGLSAGHRRSPASDSVMSASAQRAPSLSPENSFEDPKEEELGHQWPPSKVLKTMRSQEVDEVSQQMSHVKKARVSVRARCDAPTMNDGCQWRKYGQKISKGNPCPRAYYRCTVAPACPVRKQVQRCAEDMSILITTYEGTHNHPLPMAATAMASTTSAAASMLLSGSSATSRPSIGAPLVNSTVISPGGSAGISAYPGLHGLNFNITDSSRQRPSYYIPPASPLAPSPSHPTITLDLTNPSSSTSVITTTFPSHLSRFGSSYTSSLPRYSTSLSFCGPTDSSSSLPSTTWDSGGAGSYLSYGSQLYGNSGKSGSHTGGGALMLGRQGMQDQLFQQSTSVPFWQRSAAVASSSSTPSTNAITVASAATGSAIQSAFTDTLTKAITSDPSFQTVLAAAITSIVGGGSAAAEALGKSGPTGIKWGDHLPSALSAVSTSTSAPNSGGGSGCAVSYLNRDVPPASSTMSATVQPRNLMFLQPSLSLSNPRSSSSSPVENREHTS